MGRSAEDPVLVGVDGSEESRRAVRWAAREAVLLGTGLRVVHAWTWPLYRAPLGPDPGSPGDDSLEAQAHEVLAGSTRLAHEVAPHLPVETELTVGAADAQLLDYARGAALVVVGNRGLGGFTGLLVGSVGIALSAHAPCPVVVVRGRPAANGPVVVGVDAKQPDPAVLRTAFEEADRRGVPLLAVHAWTLALAQGPATGLHEHALEHGERMGRELLEREVTSVADRYPAVVAQARVGARSAAAELVDASQDAQLVVVGSSGAGALRGALLGSTAHALIPHAACPVLISR
jgi:nucleotide-binding universal stress UspA family protein